MTAETILERLTQYCDLLRSLLFRTTQELQELNKRLTQISQQIHKNIDVRDNSFAEDFNAYCQNLRKQLDKNENAWLTLRAQARAHKQTDWDASLALPAKGLNSHAKMLSRVCDEFSTTYGLFIQSYKGFTASKLNVWLLTSCENDLTNLTGKILFLAREIAKNTEKSRGKNASR